MALTNKVLRQELRPPTCCQAERYPHHQDNWRVTQTPPEFLVRRPALFFASGALAHGAYCR